MEEFAAKSNKSDLAGMSNAENAIADARRILDAHLLDRFFPSDNGDVLAASNNDFITDFLNIIGGREEYIDKNGARKPNLAPRIKAAVLAAMLNPEKRDIIENLLDNPQGWNGLINGLFGSVANLAKLDGNADYNLADELSKAVEIFVGLQRAGESVATFNAQGDMFNEPISDEVGFLIELFEKNTRTPTGISGVLNEYYNLVKNIDTTTQDMFGAENPSKIDELRAAYQKYSTSLTEEPNVSWRNTGEPTEAEIAEAQRQKDEVKAKWTNPDGTMKKGYHLAPNGKESRLTEDQWLQVRTPNFKKWFGDWETLAIFNEVENMPASAIKLHESLDKAGIKETFKSFGEVENRRDGRVVVFPTASAGKIRRHKGFDSGTVIKNFKTLFETAIPAISEEEVLKDGHKAHGNIDAVEHYVNKFSANGIEYFIRFTVPVIRNNKGAGNVHSSAISEVSIYKNGDSTLYPLNTAGSSSPSFVDGKLADFLNAVNKKDVSKVVDENGEPLVVYHGTDWKPLAEKAGEAVFKSSLIKNSSEGVGFYFTKDKTLASGFGEPVACFLNLRNPKYAYDRLSLISTEELEEGDVDVENFDAENAARIRNALGEWKNAMEAKGWDFYNEIDPYLLDGLPKETNTIESILDYVLSADSFLKAEDYYAEDFYNDAREAAADVFGIDGYISENYGNDSGVYVALKPNQIKSTTDNVGTFSENPDIRWSIREDSAAEKIDTQFGELYERYKNGDKAAYEEAAKLVADYAESKGYDVKVYHGTGADGFNVAKADASEAKNGEGAQAHGMGLYLATEKRTAKGYKDRARKPNPVVKINGKVVDAGKISKDLMLPELGIIEVLQRISNFGYDSQLKYLELQKKSAEDALKLAESGVDEFGYHLFEEEKTSRINRANEEIEFWQRDIDNLQRLVDWVKKNLGADITNDSHSISVKSPEGKVFDWLTNLKPENVIDEEKSLSEQPEIWEKLKKIWKTVVYPKIEKGLGNDDSAAAHAQHYKPTNWIAGEAIVFGWGNFLGKTRFNKLMLENGIRGITYDGQIDGRCYVSFEGGSAVKLQDPFTFDDNGQLIPLSKRFDSGNPDMRWRDDTIDTAINEADAEIDKEHQLAVDETDSKIENAKKKFIQDNFNDNNYAVDDDEYALKFYENEEGIEDIGSPVRIYYGLHYGGNIVEFNKDGKSTFVTYDNTESANRLYEYDSLEKAKTDQLKDAWEEYFTEEDSLGYVDNPYENDETNILQRKFVRAMEKLGIKVKHKEIARTGSEYVYIETPSGDDMKIRIADHPVVYSADVSIEQGDWKGAVRYVASVIDDWHEDYNEGETMRWRDVEETPNLFERLKGVQGESTTEEKLKESGDLKYYFDYFKKNLLGREIQTPIGKFARFNLGHFNKLIARGENKGESEAVSSLKEWTDKIEKHGVDLGKNPPKGFDYARACNMPLVVDVLQNPQFVLVDTDDTLLFVKKYGEKTYFWCSVMNNGATLGIKSWRPLRLTKTKCEQLKVVYTKENGVVNLAQPRESQRKLDSTNLSENQEKNSRLRFLLRQERTENPVIWASIVLAREILNGRGITRAKVEKLLPTEQFDGSKQNYAVERAQRIAEKTKATQKQFSKDLDIAIRKAESNLYWQDEFVENAYRAFSKGGEEYGFAKQRLMQYLKDLRNKELNKVKGYETDDFDVDLVDAILKAQEAEPERAASDESKSAGEEAEEELEESGGAFEGDEELSGKKTPLAPSKIRDVIGAIRREVVKRVRDSDGDQKTLDEKYRKTLVNVLTDAMKELVYGKEREDIGKKIEELKNVKHAVIIVKDGERVGQKIDNFTLRAENIALRIFKRGVRDSKKLMTDKLDAILKRRGKKPSRMQRDDKRSMTGLVQQRIYNISRYVEMDAEALEDVRREAVEKLENVDGNFVQDAEKGKIREDVEDVRACYRRVECLPSPPPK